MTGSETRARMILAALLLGLALVAAGVALWSLSVLQTRLQEDRLAAQGGAIAETLALHVDAGVPLADATGFSAAARTLLRSEPALSRVALLDAKGGVVAAVGADAPCSARCLDIEVRSRNPQVGAISEIGDLRLTLAPAQAVQLSGIDPLALAAIAALALIGVIYFVSIADVSALGGMTGARLWIICALAPALALAVWLVIETGEAYRDRAQSATDVLADRLRAAVDIGVDPLSFAGLDQLLSTAGRAAGDDKGALQFALFEGRRPIYGVGAGAMDELLEPSQLDLVVSRSIRPRTLNAPSLSIVAQIGWGPIARRTPEDHFIALAALLAYVFVPALILSFRGRATA